MPRGPAPGWRKRKEPVADDWIMASVNKAGGLGKHHPDTGFYAGMVMKDLADREEAEEWSRALFRSAAWMHKYGIANVGVTAKIRRRAAGYVIEYTAINKTHAQAYTVRTRGSDPSKWPYWARGGRAT